MRSKPIDQKSSPARTVRIRKCPNSVIFVNSPQIFSIFSIFSCNFSGTAIQTFNMSLRCARVVIVIVTNCNYCSFFRNQILLGYEHIVWVALMTSALGLSVSVRHITKPAFQCFIDAGRLLDTNTYYENKLNLPCLIVRIICFACSMEICSL